MTHADNAHGSIRGYKAARSVNMERPSDEVTGQMAKENGNKHVRAYKKDDSHNIKKVETVKEASRKGENFVSPRLVFIKRNIRHIQREIEADKKTCLGKTCRNIVVFAGIYAVLFFIRGGLRQYFTNVLEHIQRQFTLSMRELEFLVGVEKIGFVLIIIFSGYYGNKMHKPVAILVAAVFCACGAAVCAVPYFIDLGQGRPNKTDASLYYLAGLCQIGDSDTQTTKTQCDVLVHHPNQTQAFSIMATGNFLVGVGTAFLIVLGFIYVEEAAPKTTAPLYYGIILASNGLGELLGLLASWQFTKYSHTLQSLLGSDVWTEGAWWLGLIIIAGLFLLVPLPLLVFPKWIQEPKWLINRRNRLLKHYAVLLENEERLIRRIKRRKRRKKRKEEIAKRKKERAERDKINDSAVPDGIVTDIHVPNGNMHETEGNENKQIDGKQKDGRGGETNTGMIETEKDGHGPIGDTANGHGLTTKVGTDGHFNGNSTREVANGFSYVTVDVHAGYDNPESRDPDSGDDSDNEELDPEQTQDAADDANVDNNEVASDDVDTSNAAPQRGVRFATDDAGEILIEVVMDVDDVLQSEEPPRDPDAADDDKVEKSDSEKKRQMLGRRIQDLPRNIWFLINRPVYSLVLTGTILAAYSPAGYQATLPAYVSAQLPMYHLPGVIMAGGPYTVGLTLGTLASGLVLYRRGWNLLTHIQIIMCIQAIVTVLFLLAMAPSCNLNYIFSSPHRNNTTVTQESCSSKCDCLQAQYHPVCSPSGIIYSSACLAGCRTSSYGHDGGVIFDQCLCSPDVAVSSTSCNNSCYGATAGYGILVFLISLCQSSGYVSLLVICLRCIAQKLRVLALGFAFCMILLAAYVPGHAVFRAIHGVACTYNEDNCLGDHVCWSYDSKTFRFVYHGAAAVFQLASLIFYTAAFFVLRNKAKAVKKITSSGADDQNTATPGEENRAFSCEGIIAQSTI